MGPAEGEVRLDKFLASHGGLGSRSRAARAIARGQVFLNGREAGPDDAAVRLVAGDRVGLWLDRPGSARSSRTGTGDVAILHEDHAIIVVNKPPGLLTVPVPGHHGRTSVQEQLVDYLRSQRARPFVVHRIDRDTSGLVVFAKQERTQMALKAQFRRREPERVYWAVVYGQPDPSTGVWRDHLVWDPQALVQKATHPSDPRAAQAESRYRVLEQFPDCAVVEVSLVTGKRNQIRIQARLRGHTLVGEQRYVFGPATLRPIAFPRQALHARRLGFNHPGDGRALTFEAPLPQDMAELLARLRQSSQTALQSP